MGLFGSKKTAKVSSKTTGRSKPENNPRASEQRSESSRTEDEQSGSATSTSEASLYSEDLKKFKNEPENAPEGYKSTHYDRRGNPMTVRVPFNNNRKPDKKPADSVPALMNADVERKTPSRHKKSSDPWSRLQYIGK